VSSKPQRWRLPALHRDLLRGALSDGKMGNSVTDEQRLVLRQICSAPERTTFEPEDFLIAFKLAVVDAANDVGIPVGPERNDFLARLVSVYIEEFFRLPLTRDGDGNGKADGQVLAAGEPGPMPARSDVAHTSPDARP
jgi:hypothetical protein